MYKLITATLALSFITACNGEKVHYSMHTTYKSINSPDCIKNTISSNSEFSEITLSDSKASLFYKNHKITLTYSESNITTTTKSENLEPEITEFIAKEVHQLLEKACAK